MRMPTISNIELPLLKVLYETGGQLPSVIRHTPSLNFKAHITQLYLLYTLQGKPNLEKSIK